MAAIQIQAPSDLSLYTVFDEVVYPAAAVAARQKVVPPRNARRLVIHPQPLADGAATPTNAGIYVVLDAISDGDADSRLGRAGRIRIRVDQAETINLDKLSPCGRIDVIGTSTANEANGMYVGFSFGMDF